MGNYFIYITTNPGKTVLYIGMTNDLRTRMRQHQASKEDKKTFAGKYHCYKLVYYERFDVAYDAIDREKELKKWNRKKKELLIATTNPSWDFLDAEFLV